MEPLKLRTATIRTSYRISQILAKGSVRRGPFFDVKRLSNTARTSLSTSGPLPGKGPRFVVIVSKRTARSAVDRNRIKRRIKEALRHILKKNVFAEFDYVIIGKLAAIDVPFETLLQEMDKIMLHSSH